MNTNIEVFLNLTVQIYLKKKKLEPTRDYLHLLILHDAFYDIVFHDF